MTLHIAPLCSSDALVLGPAHNRVWRVAYRGLLPDDVLDARDDAVSICRWLEMARQHEEQGASAQGCRTSVAHDDDGTPVGWIGVGPARDADPPADVELWSLYVIPERWGEGIARQLVETCLPPGPAYLWVLAGNERALAFYRMVGFAIDGVEKLFGATGVSELRMVYERYPGAMSENRGFNKVRGISPTNPNRSFYMQSAQDYFDGLGGR